MWDGERGVCNRCARMGLACEMVKAAPRDTRPRSKRDRRRVRPREGPPPRLTEECGNSDKEESRYLGMQLTSLALSSVYLY